jgi:membrane protein YqaA with SNARE-associated domain
MSRFFTQPAHAHPLQAHPALMPRWLMHLGAFGLFLVAIVDSSPIPLPIPGSTDLLLLLLVSHSGSIPWLLASCAISGSILGGYTTWHLGHKGGEAALKRYVPARLLGRVVGWVKDHHILAVFLPAILPPPIPLLPFALASGALGVTRTRFLTVFGIARALRYSFVAWLGVTYGRKVTRLFSTTLQKWSTPLICVFVTLMVASLIFTLLKIRKMRKDETADESALRTQSV